MNYAIVLWAAVQGLTRAKKKALLAAVEETAWKTVRHSVTAPDEIVLKWNGTGNPCDDAGVANTVYTRAEILEELATPHWNHPEE